MNDIIIPFFDVRCVSQRGYGYTKREAGRRLPTMKGRPRYRRRDSHASYLVTVEWEFTPDQYTQFQDFWYDDLEAGLNSFILELMLDDPEFFVSNGESYLVHATGGYNAVVSSFNTTLVTLEVEVSGGYRVNQFDCPIIYGGPIDSPSPDHIYGGPIDALAEDVIVPCPGVDPNG